MSLPNLLVSSELRDKLLFLIDFYRFTEKVYSLKNLASDSLASPMRMMSSAYCPWLIA